MAGTKRKFFKHVKFSSSFAITISYKMIRSSGGWNHHVEHCTKHWKLTNLLEVNVKQGGQRWWRFLLPHVYNFQSNSYFALEIAVLSPLGWDRKSHWRNSCRMTPICLNCRNATNAPSDSPFVRLCVELLRLFRANWLASITFMGVMGDMKSPMDGQQLPEPPSLLLVSDNILTESVRCMH